MDRVLFIYKTQYSKYSIESQKEGYITLQVTTIQNFFLVMKLDYLPPTLLLFLSRGLGIERFSLKPVRNTQVTWDFIKKWMKIQHLAKRFGIQASKIQDTENWLWNINHKNNKTHIIHFQDLCTFPQSAESIQSFLPWSHHLGQTSLIFCFSENNNQLKLPEADQEKNKLQKMLEVDTQQYKSVWKTNY